MTARSTTLLLLSAAVLTSWAVLNGAAAEVRTTTPASCQSTAANVVPISASATALDPRALPAPGEVAQLRAKSLGLIGQGDIAGARLVLVRAASGGDACALFALAETYDPTRFEAWGVIGMRSDAGRAVSLHQQALRAGLPDAQARLDWLR